MNSKNYIPRTLEQYAFDPKLVARHMVFIAGPRQVGKTVLAQKWLLKNHCSSLYFNWDDPKTRKAYLDDSSFFESPARLSGRDEPWIVFDEIHKRYKWKDLLKGIYDRYNEHFRFLITGSARLDLFRQSGDSLVGRYSLFHLFPFSLSEVTSVDDNRFLIKEAGQPLIRAFQESIPSRSLASIGEAFSNLYERGPFPEPYLHESMRFCRKWHDDYQSLLILEDLRDISRVTSIDKIEQLLYLLPSRLCSPLSMNNLARDLEVAHTSIKKWLEQLKRLYLVFPVPPWSRKVSRGLRKEKKWYFVDWYFAADNGARLENMIACLLYRSCTVLTDMGYGTYELHYVRTLDRKEIDFLVTRDRIPLLTCEVKNSRDTLSRGLRDRSNWFPEPVLGVQIVKNRDILKQYDTSTWIMSADLFSSLLP